MNKELRRKQKKAKKASRLAQRRSKAANRARPPWLDPELPMTKVEIEAEMNALLAEAISEPKSSVNFHRQGRFLLLSPAQDRLLRLQRQLFCVVFGREPRGVDPVFWDRDRESEGVFPIDPEKGKLGLEKALLMAKVGPAIAYAVAFTGICPIGQEGLYTEEELAAFEDAVADYLYQEEHGVPPLTPEEFLNGWEAMNRVAKKLRASISMRMHGREKKVTRELLAALEDELGTRQKAAAMVTRVAALIDTTKEEAFRYLDSPDGFPEEALIVAACADIDKTSRRFDLESFRRRLDAYWAGAAS